MHRGEIVDRRGAIGVVTTQQSKGDGPSVNGKRYESAEGGQSKSRAAAIANSPSAASCGVESSG